MMSEFRRRLLMQNALKGEPKPTGYIKFEDPEIERICIENWSTDKVGLTYEDAANVKSFNRKFQNNTLIKTFNELQYFINVQFREVFSGSDFYGCTALEEITLMPNAILNYYTIQCDNLKKVNGLERILVLGTGAFYVCSRLKIDILRLPLISGRLHNRTFCYSQVNRVEDLGSIEELREVGYIEGPFAWRDKSPSFIRFPKTLKLIQGKWFLRENYNLLTIVFESVIPPTIEGGDYFLGRNNQLESIYVPDESVEAYKTAPIWNAFADKFKPLSTYVEPTK